MIEIIGKNPVKICSSCKCTFSFDKNDVKKYNEEYWAGFWKGGWLTRCVRYVVCPGCSKEIRLND